MLGTAYVRRTYNKFKARYWPGVDLPDFDDLDFEWTDPNPRPKDFEWGSVSWDAGGPTLTMNGYIRVSASAIKGTLLHEMVHLVLGPNKGHGAAFKSEAKRIHQAEAWREYF